MSPIDLDRALGAALPPQALRWTEADVARYRGAVGVGGTTTVPPTFLPAWLELFRAAPPTLSFPGVALDLAAVVHAGQEIVVHTPPPERGHAHAHARIADVLDKGTAAVIVHATEIVGEDGVPLMSARAHLHARGGGGFGGRRGPAVARVRAADVPDHVVETATSPRQAHAYRICGDRNPVHTDPAAARAAGLPGPTLQGMCTYGIVCAAIVDAVLDGDVRRVARYAARFSGPVFPGETLRTRIWRTRTGVEFVTATADRAVLDGSVQLRQQEQHL